MAANKQIWDVRFNNTTPLSGSDITAYVTYMAAGGAVFVMGENTGFVTRDNSIAALLTAAGGGSITLTTPANAETVLIPFDGPNSVSSVTFLAAAGVATPGNGACVTKDSGNLCAAFVLGPGNMSNATAGSLIVVFDVNFLDPGSGYTAGNGMTAFVPNLIAYLAAPVSVAPPVNRPASVPTLSATAMLALSIGLLFVVYRRLRTA